MAAFEQSGPAADADHRFSAEYEACLASANGFTVARTSCHNAELARQTARVDRALNAVLATRKGEARQRLLQDQRAWLGRRDAECQDNPSRGSTDVLHEGSCRIDMTAQRAGRLERMVG